MSNEQVVEGGLEQWAQTLERRLYIENVAHLDTLGSFLIHLEGTYLNMVERKADSPGCAHFAAIVELHMKF